VLGMFVRTE